MIFKIPNINDWANPDICHILEVIYNFTFYEQFASCLHINRYIFLERLQHISHRFHGRVTFFANFLHLLHLNWWSGAHLSLVLFLNKLLSIIWIKYIRFWIYFVFFMYSKQFWLHFFSWNYLLFGVQNLLLDSLIKHFGRPKEYNWIYWLATWSHLLHK